MGKIELAIAGVGNCTSSLLQGIEYYQTHVPNDTAGLIHPLIGGYGLGDIHVVAAFDIDRRKVGKPLEEAVFAPRTAPRSFIANSPPIVLLYRWARFWTAWRAIWAITRMGRGSGSRMKIRATRLGS